MSVSEADVVTFERVGDHVALVTIQRPEARNAINTAVTARIRDIVRATEEDSSIWAVVLTGAGGRAFSAGADLKEFSGGKGDGLFDPDSGFAGFVRADRSKLWIAAVDGFALAGGCELALACDMIVASEDAQFGLPEVKRGLMAVAGGLFRLPRSVPRAIAMEMIATGDPIDVQKAYALGLVNKVVDKSAVVSEALALAQRICMNAPVAVRESLVIARRSFDETEQTLHRLSNEAQTRIAVTEDFIEGPRAFIEKRMPRWAGR